MSVNIKFVAAALLLAPCLAAYAAPMTYFGEDPGNGENIPLATFPNASAAQSDFLASLINPGVENFEGFTAGTGAPLNVNFTGAGTTALLTGAGNVAAAANGSANHVGRYGISGDPDGDGYDQYWDVSGGFELHFDKPVAAFGFYGIDIGDFGGQVTATTGGGLAQTFIIPNTTNIAGGSVLFWGVIDSENTFTKITFGNISTDFFGFDNSTIASLKQINTSVPAPGTLFLLAAGLLLIGIGGARRPGGYPGDKPQLRT